jgi:hypothetical protein
MRTCVTKAVIGAGALLLGAAASAGDLELRGEGTLGAKLYQIDPPYDNSDLSSWFDQYWFIRDQGDPVPYFIDFFHLDVGLAREDDTYLARLERWSTNAINERGQVDADWKGLDFDLGWWRYRSDDLRLFPVGTGGSIPVFGTVYNPDTPFDEISQEDRRFWLERTGFLGDLRFRPDAFGLGNPVVAQASIFGGYEGRDGWNQDSFLLDAIGEPVTTQTARFRGYRQDLDQGVGTFGGGLVLGPWQRVTTALDGSFQTFRENAPVVTLDTLAATDPRIDPMTPAQGERAFDFIPDTNRATGQLRVSGWAGPAFLNAGAFVTNLAQTGRLAPYQNRFPELPTPEVTTWSAQGAFDWPIRQPLGLNGFVKYLRRDNGLDPGLYDAAFGAAGGQLDPFIKARDEVDGGLELAADPVPGTQAALGYRLHYVTRDLRFAGAGGLSDNVNLYNEEAFTQNPYIRARARLLRSLQLRGELGFTISPQVTFPNDLQHSFYVRGQGAQTWWRPIPVTLSVFGRFLDGRNDDYSFPSANEQDKTKTFERIFWTYGVTLSVVPVKSLSVFGSFFQSRDDQTFTQLRSTLPRTSQPLDFFVDSVPDYTSNLRSLVLGVAYPLTKSLDASLWSTITWADMNFGGKGYTPNVLEDVDSFTSRITSFEVRLGYKVRPGVRTGIGYRFDHYTENGFSTPLSPDTLVQTITMDVTVDMDALKKLPSVLSPPRPRR